MCIVSCIGDCTETRANEARGSAVTTNRWVGRALDRHGCAPRVITDRTVGVGAEGVDVGGRLWGNPTFGVEAHAL